MDTYNPKPILDSILYQVQFQNNTLLDYATNVNTENMFANVDEQGYNASFLEDIDNHCKNKYDVH